MEGVGGKLANVIILVQKLRQVEGNYTSAKHTDKLYFTLLTFAVGKPK